MILGIGIDAVEIPRIEAGLKRFGDRFITRIARPAERAKEPAHERRRCEYWAARFAAKEAFAKALGTGIGRSVPWKSVGVTKARSGKPDLEYSAELALKLQELGVTRSHLAITHTLDTAIAVVILEGSRS